MIQKTAQTLCRSYSGVKVLRFLKLKRSTYFARLKPIKSARMLENERFFQLIQAIYTASKGRYGAPKIHQKLLQAGEKLSLKRVQKLMLKAGLRAITVRKWRAKRAEQSRHTHYPNLLAQDFSADTLNQKWSTDITYIHTQSQGWCYLSSIMDLCSRKIIAWKFSKQMTLDLVQETLEQVKNRVQPGLILQTDRGSQYTSIAYEAQLQSLGIRHSYSQKGYPYDNSCIESFHASLKKEEVYQQPSYATFEVAKLALFEYIEGWYNRKRIHSKIGYKTPQEFESILTAL